MIRDERLYGAWSCEMQEKIETWESEEDPSMPLYQYLGMTSAVEYKWFMVARRMYWDEHARHLS